VHKPLSTHVASIILTTPVSASKMPQDNSHSLAHRGTTSSSTETPALASRGEKHGATGSLYPVLAIEDIYLAAGAALQDRLVDLTFVSCPLRSVGQRVNLRTITLLRQPSALDTALNAEAPES
jgi:hypothetical protein